MVGRLGGREVEIEGGNWEGGRLFREGREVGREGWDGGRLGGREVGRETGR